MRKIEGLTCEVRVFGKVATCQFAMRKISNPQTGLKPGSRKPQTLNHWGVLRFKVRRWCQ